MKTIVAIFAALLVLVAPAVAQDPGPQGDGQDPPASDPPQGEPSSNETAASPPSSSPTSCPVVESNVGDPTVPKTQWVIVDPNGCLQQLIYRILTWPPAKVVTRRL